MVLGVYGYGGLGREVMELAQLINSREKRWDDLIFIIDGNPKKEKSKIRVYSYEAAIQEYEGRLEVSMGIGEPIVRERLFQKLSRDGILLATLIHPNVHIPETTSVGRGVTIQYGCFISCNVDISDYVYIQPHVNIGHDDVIREGAMLSGMVNLAGHVTVGEYTYVALNVAVKEGVTIGNHCIIGMCSAVHKDIPDEMIAMGNPARPMKKNEDRSVFK